MTTGAHLVFEDPPPACVRAGPSRAMTASAFPRGARPVRRACERQEVRPRAGSRGAEPALGVELTGELLERALTHRSYAYENGGLPTNERLEFLGDSVLGLVVTDTLLPRPPRPARGAAGQAARRGGQHARARRRRPPLGLGAHIRLGRGEEGTGGRDKSSILADTLEALIGAVYLDRGLDEAAALVHRLFDAAASPVGRAWAPAWTGRPRCRS